MPVMTIVDAYKLRLMRPVSVLGGNATVLCHNDA